MISIPLGYTLPRPDPIHSLLLDSGCTWLPSVVVLLVPRPRPRPRRVKMIHTNILTNTTRCAHSSPFQCSCTLDCPPCTVVLTQEVKLLHFGVPRPRPRRVGITTSQAQPLTLTSTIYSTGASSLPTLLPSILPHYHLSCLLCISCVSSGELPDALLRVVPRPSPPAPEGWDKDSLPFG